MEEFLLQNYSLITRSVEIMAAITGVLLYKKYKSIAAKYFIYFLVYLSVCDFIGTYTYYIDDSGVFSFLKGTRLEKNNWWSTLYWKIGAVLFFAFYYQKILKERLNQSIVRKLSYFFIIFSVIWIISHWNDFFVKSFPILSILGALFIFLCVILYFIEVLQSERILVFYKSINFYISTAILIWWLVITPLVFYDVYFSTADWNFVFLKWQIYLFSNIFMYSMFTFALLWCKPEND